MQTTYDIVIIGAGTVGLTLACALGESRLKIAVLDSCAPIIAWSDEEYDTRVSAITPASQAVFSALKVWPGIIARRISPFQKMHVWDAAGAGIIDFDCMAIKAETLGFIIENRVLQAALYEQLQAYSNINFITGRLHMLENKSEQVEIKLANEQQITAKLVIGADGAESRVRQLANITYHHKDYEQNALVATVRCSLPHQAAAWQCFLPDGILAFLPLAEANQCSIVWSTTPQETKRLMALTATEFCQALTDAFAQRLGIITEIKERLAFPLAMRHAQQYVKPRIALIGDAAHTIHPLAGQGVNLGILDAASLAEVILAAQAQRDIGSMAVLRRYERWRKGENLMMLTTVRALKDLFVNQNALLKTVRTFGINWVNKTSPLKNYLMKRAMGQVGDLPKLARQHA